MKEVFFIVLSNPYVAGIATALNTWLILAFWSDIFIKTRKTPRYIRILFSLINGVLSCLSSMNSLESFSPITFSLIVPVILFLQLYALGSLGKWGNFFMFSVTSFQLITLYSVSLGVTNYIFGNKIFESSAGHAIAVTMSHAILCIFMAELRAYTIAVKSDRNDELQEIVTQRNRSNFILVYALINSIAVTILTIELIYALTSSSTVDRILLSASKNAIIRDLILFFSTVMMLDVQTRNLKKEKTAENKAKEAENKATEAIAASIMMEKNLQTQSFIQQALEAERQELEAKNQELANNIEYEKELRKRLRRNVLFRFSANITKDILDDPGALNVDILNEGKEGPLAYSLLLTEFIELFVHPDNKDVLEHKMSVDYLTSLEFTDRGFESAFKLIPGSLMNHIALDDDAAKIYGYIDREYIWTNLDCSVTRGENGDLFAYFYVMDVDEQKQQEEAIKKAAATDALTGLFNRRAFERLLSEFMESEECPGGALFMFDLDHFKSVNDNLGHPKGDELLKDVSDILRGTFRSNDLLCRIGGDEFCAFAKGFTDENLILQRADLLNQIGRQTFPLENGEEIHVSFSIGIAVIPTDATETKELYKCADSALYEAKESGRDCYKRFKPEMLRSE